MGEHGATAESTPPEQAMMAMSSICCLRVSTASEMNSASNIKLPVDLAVHRLTRSTGQLVLGEAGRVRRSAMARIWVEVTGVVTAVHTDGRGGHARRQLHDGEEGVVGHAAAAGHADDELGGQGSHRTEGRGRPAMAMKTCSRRPRRP